MEFTDAEIREELGRLGYKDVPDDKLQDFKKDLLKLIQSERSKTASLNSSIEDKQNEEDEPIFQKQTNDDKNYWAEPVYREDWQYQVRDKYRPATTGRSRSNNASKSFGLFEQPLDDLGLQVHSERHPPMQRNNSSCKLNDSCCCCFCYDFDAEKKQMKRKTARPATSSSYKCLEDDPSETDAAGIYELYERVRNLAMRDCECHGGGKTTAHQEPPYRIHGVNKCPSIIRTGEPPHTRNLVKTIPWKRHQMYVRMWKAQPVIGEDNRNALRKETQAKMLQKMDVKPQRKVFKPNKYVPPPENPRYQLRWEVRRANSQFEMPSNSHSYHNTNDPNF